MADDHKILLSESELPHAWYTSYDMPVEVSPLSTRRRISRSALRTGAAVPHGPYSARSQHRALHRDPRRGADILASGGLSAHRAINPRSSGTPARIYYKNEGVSPPAAIAEHAVAQAYYNKMEGVRTLTTETGAGQWGCALAFACQLFGLELGLDGQGELPPEAYRRSLMQLWVRA